MSSSSTHQSPSPVIPIALLEQVVVLYLHILTLPGGLIIGQVPPLDQVVDVALLVHATKSRRENPQSQKVTLLCSPQKPDL